MTSRMDGKRRSHGWSQDPKRSQGLKWNPLDGNRPDTHHSLCSFEGTKRDFPGDHTEGEPPVPIPNTAVKPLRADGTCRATGWESRSLPGAKVRPRQFWRGLYFCPRFAIRGPSPLRA